MRGDSAARANWYKDMWSIGVFSQNDIRMMEDLDPIGPEGDEHYIQSQYTTLKAVMREAEETTEEPEEAPPIEAVAVEELMRELGKARGAKSRYDRTGFAGWIDRQQANTQKRKFLAFVNVNPEFNVAQFELYETLEREAMWSEYEGERPDSKEIVARLLETL